MRQHQAWIETLKLHLSVISFEAEPIAAAYLRQTGWPWPLLLDPDRTLYRAYGMERGGWWQIYGPSSWHTYISLIMRGRSLHRPTGDTRQLGGDVLIDPDGIVRLHHVGATPADRPPVEHLLNIVRKRT